MGDLISRQAAIEVVKHAWAKGLEPTQYLEELPAVQTCEDAVSRQAAIDVMCELMHHWFGGDPKDEVREIKRELEKLPAVQPEPCEDDPRADVYYLAEKIGINRLYALVVELRGEPESCDDAVSRQAAIDKLDPLFESLAIDKIKALPTAQDVIRCKDCRYQDKGSNESESWNLCGYRPWLHVPTEDEHYCGYAERRTDE